MRSGYQELAAKGLMTLEELGPKLEELDGVRQTARAEIDALEARKERVEELEADRDALVEFWSDAVPEQLDGLTGSERNKVYRMLRLEVTPTPEGYRVTGVLRRILHNATDDLEEVKGIGPKTVEKIKPHAKV